MASHVSPTQDTLVTLKVNFQGSTRRFKLPLRDLGATTLEDKIRATLCISSDAHATFERYSDSASAYVILEPSNATVWKQLWRAAKAKQKLKLRVTLQDSEEEDKGPKPVTVEDAPEQDNMDFAQTKPEAPLISTASSEITCAADLPDSMPRPSTRLPPQLGESNKVGFASLEVNSLDERLQRAMSQLHLNMDKSESSLAAKQAPKTASTETTSLCVGPSTGNFAVTCNLCDRTIPDHHYHCSTCEDGDFDLCPQCVEQGRTCFNTEHWLIKRFVKGDHILVSTTERVSPPKSAPKTDVKITAPKVAERRPAVQQPRATSVFAAPAFRAGPIRTCNSCVQELPDREFLHCTTCEDFDLCKECFVADKHGHHPEHGFAPAVEGTILSSAITKLLAPGRHQRHHAICDGCDKFIFGVRNKCLDCPDWDYCSDCIVNAGFIHPNHRFVPIYKQVPEAGARASSAPFRPTHYGICCDGPLCKGARRAYIVGERYKCTVCHDTDFCANCEASPANTHNRTHPLIKFKTPVRRVEITTKGEDEHGQKLPVMGDRVPRKPVNSRATETSAPSNSSTTSLHTVVDVKPEPEKESSTTPSQFYKEMAPTDVSRREKTSATASALRQRVLLQKQHKEMAERLAAVARLTKATNDQLEATYVRDTIADGTAMAPNQVFEQTWVLRNTGDVAWPAGCTVKYVGGDYMGQIDSSRPAGLRELVSASESTVCYDALAPGQEASFTVLLRAPARQGKLISWWRLTTKDGDKVGPRLWCDIAVESTKAQEPIPEPTQVQAQEVAPVEEKKEEVAAVEEQKTEVNNQMIFPTLEKESPVSSMHEAESHSVEADEEEESKDEIDWVDGEWVEDSDDAGFMTDEEYDILDASDEEFLEEQQKKTEKK